jgi:hypothetical protein
METHSPETPPEPSAPQPRDNVVTTFLFSGFSLFLERGFSGIRINDADGAWLDPIRLPGDLGLLAYAARSLVEALAISLIVGLAHWLSLRLVRRAWIRDLFGWVFLIVGVVLSFWLVRFLDRLPRVWITPSPPS